VFPKPIYFADEYRRPLQPRPAHLIEPRWFYQRQGSLTAQIITQPTSFAVILPPPPLGVVTYSMSEKRRLPTEESLRDQQSATSSKETEQTDDDNGKTERRPLFKLTFPSSLQWIPKNLTWSKMKPVIRCSLVAWISLLFMIIPKTAKMLGQVSRLWFK
jgi:hypothetical protein